MVTLPKITYKFQMLPIEIPQSFFEILKSMLIKHIWKNKKPRVNFATITREKKHRGLAAPDINRYYKATIIAHMVEWGNKDKEKEKKWIRMENSISKTTLQKSMGTTKI